MALTATASQGFEVRRYTTDHEVFYLPGDPGVTYTKGDEIYRDLTTNGKSGLIDVVGNSTPDPLGVVLETTVCPASSTPFPLPNDFDPIAKRATDLTLIPVLVACPAGVPVHWTTFRNQVDDTVISYSAASLYIAATTGHSADEYPDGALVYVYQGPGVGELNVVDRYDHTGGAVELLVQLHRKFNATLTSATKYIVITGEGATYKGIDMFGRIDSYDNNEIDAADGANDGDYVVFGGWKTLAQLVPNLMLPVVKKTSIFDT